MGRRVAIVVGTLFTVAVLGTSTPAQARGCQLFGNALAVDAQSALLGRYLSQQAPVNQFILGAHSAVCPAGN